MRRRVRPLSRVAAIQRIDRIFSLLRREVDLAMYEYAAIEAANDIVVAEMRDKPFAGAVVFNVVNQSVTHSLALRVSKIMEIPTGRRGSTEAFARNRSDLASLSQLMWFASQARCKKALGLRARGWTPHLRGSEASQEQACIDALDEAIRIFRVFCQSTGGRRSLEQLKRFRNNVLAHSLLGQSSERLPTYNQLFTTLKMVREVWAKLRLAIAGEAWGEDDFAKHQMDEALRFWRPALRAVIKAG